MRLATAIPVLLSILPMSGCAVFGPASQSAFSSGAVALNGGLVGQTAFAAEMPDRVRTKALEAEFQALQFSPAGQAVRWSEDGYSGEVVPTQVYRVGSQDCRAYTHVLSAGSKPVKTTGVACKTESGLWKPVA
ncbi:hypothetical protein E3C22_16845 [Jiella endophytica]|uniref:Surface antigen domain-containing protein n=1 Tax=Jiella endophytica TaxID=2558362 RepID=A0A4Y8REC6_9HYPH|nr:hypothetical protein [Jiella endophytica]TFF20571.1 hypothetical protein E3C22_16845 [Jiella endophytica]